MPAFALMYGEAIAALAVALVARIVNATFKAATSRSNFDTLTLTGALTFPL
jgi:hypothetical protein